MSILVPCSSCRNAVIAGREKTQCVLQWVDAMATLGGVLQVLVKRKPHLHQRTGATVLHAHSLTYTARKGGREGAGSHCFLSTALESL